VKKDFERRFPSGYEPGLALVLKKRRIIVVKDQDLKGVSRFSNGNRKHRRKLQGQRVAEG
jgi:hypothetical protein